MKLIQGINFRFLSLNFCYFNKGKLTYNEKDVS